MTATNRIASSKFAVRAAALHDGRGRRWNWRTRARFGAGWSAMTDGQIRRELRMVSHRRA